MSIRYIGQDHFSPFSPHNFARGQTKIFRSLGQPDETEKKRNAHWYK